MARLHRTPRVIKLLAACGLALLCAIQIAGAQPMGPSFGPDETDPQPPQPQPPTAIDIAAPLEKLAADAPADWREAAEHLLAAGEPAIAPLLERIDGDDHRLAIRAESVLRRMGLTAVPALRAAGRSALASTILLDRVRVLLTAPQLGVQLPGDKGTESVAPIDASTSTVTLARGTSTPRFDLIELFRFVPQADGSVVVRGLRFMCTPLHTPEGDTLPDAPADVRVFPLGATMPAGQFAAWVDTLQIIGTTTFSGPSAGAQKGDAVRQPAGADEAVDDTSAPVRWFHTRLHAGGESLLAADWVGGDEFTRPDYQRGIAPFRALSAFLPPADLQPIVMDAADRQWLAAECTQLHGRSRWPAPS